ncbi:hypothetical protein DP939_41395 [Spongiactinospora rosea]|uniref:Uncharacterized protein n=1 Tax=Spongiactinospora rosea TaxID=2248750 RepID=A0A366LLU7_9ACTN|nr:hypothetical protein [Spongiactinospora rosea]RBQ14274.1 hypothetical protein DP939_41395 [Spongiactinospora rosea]
MAVAVVAVFVMGGPEPGVREAPVVAAACPQRWGGTGTGGWVPVAGRVEGAGEALVPGVPVKAMICAYPGVNDKPGGERLAGTRTLTAGVRAMARDIAWTPIGTGRGVCTAMAGPMTNYLVRFAYPDGSALWLGSAEEVNSCAITTNGTVASGSYIGAYITAAYRTGTWRPVRQTDACQGTTGRRGQEDTMVPGEPVSVTVCRRTSPVETATRLRYGAREAAALAEALNAPRARESEHGCSGGPDDAVDFRLVFGYRDGPPVDVTFTPGCAPPIDSGTLQTGIAPELGEQIIRMAPAR